MSEAKRYIAFIGADGEFVQHGDPTKRVYGGHEVVLASDYDEATDRNRQLELAAGLWRSVFTAVVDELGRDEGSTGDAPGHSHDVPGIWDRDNGERAGKTCAWCLLWKSAKQLVQPHADEAKL
jgi:hypothetical protein